MIRLKDETQLTSLTPHTLDSRSGHLIPHGNTGDAGQLQMRIVALRGFAQYHDD